MNTKILSVPPCANFLWNEAKHVKALHPTTIPPGKLPPLTQLRFEKACGAGIATLARRYGVRWEDVERALAVSRG